MKRLLAALAILQAIVLGASAQTPDDLNEGTRLEYDSANSIWRFRWWGRSGRTYFIQHSDNLMEPWQWVPMVEVGNDSIKEWGFTSTSNKIFFRLKYSDQATADPNGDDFDGDGISNLTELQMGLNPISTDSDGDGMADGWEISHGLNPLVNDSYLDPDGDGRANITEYLAGTDPQVADGEVGQGFSATGLRVYTPLE